MTFIFIYISGKQFLIEKNKWYNINNINNLKINQYLYINKILFLKLRNYFQIGNPFLKNIFF